MKLNNYTLMDVKLINQLLKSTRNSGCLLGTDVQVELLLLFATQVEYLQDDK